MNPKTPTALLITSALPGGAAHGSIVYTNFNSQVFSNAFAGNTYVFTVNGNSANGQFTLLYEDGNSQKPEIRGDGVNTLLLSRTWQDTNNMDLNNRSYGGLPITYGGVMVNANMIDVNPARQVNGITSLMVQTNGYMNDRPNTSDTDTGGSGHLQYLGDWGQIVTNTGYVGLVMVGGGVTNYGWAHLTWTDPNTAYNPTPTNYSITLIDGAYQTTPNVGILTGDGTPGVPVISSVNLSSASTTNYTGACIELAANVSGGTSFKWQAGTGALYTNLTDGGSISGSATPNLLICPANLTNSGNYILIATDSSGSTTSSPPVSLTMISPGSTPTTGTGLYNAFQGQTDFTYAGGRNNASYKASNGKTYWLFTKLCQGTMSPVDDSFSAMNPNLVDNKILMESGSYLVPADLTPSTGISFLEYPSAYHSLGSMFEADGSIFVVAQRTDSTFYNRYGADIVRYAAGPGGVLQFSELDFTPTSGSNQITTVASANILNVQYTDGAVVQNGYVYFFGDAYTVPGGATYLARVPTNGLGNTIASQWSYWNGTSWDVQITNSAFVISNRFAQVGFYQGNWVAVCKPYGIDGTEAIAYTATQPQGPYNAPQYLFTDTTISVGGLGETTNQVTGADEYYYTASPAFHPEDSSSSNLVFSIDWWDGTDYTYNSADAEIYKPRFYTVTLTNLVLVSPRSTMTIQQAGPNVTLNWTAGTLLEATNIAGPWVTNLATSPYTFTPTAPQQFFRTIQ